MLTKDELREKDDAFLLDIVEKAKEKHHTGTDFCDYFDFDFSYSFVTGELKDRGYVNGYIKPIENYSNDELMDELNKRGISFASSSTNEKDLTDIFTKLLLSKQNKKRVSVNLTDDAIEHIESLKKEYPFLDTWVIVSGLCTK